MIKKHLSALLLAAAANAQTAIPLDNPGFEEDLNSWRVKENVVMSTATPDAAHSGERGLRVEDQDEKEGSSAVSARIEVEPGATYRISFMARTRTPGAVGVYAWFYKRAAGEFLKVDPPRVATINQGDGDWHSYTLEVEAPAEAGFMALWVHSLGQGTGAADLDDFVIERL